MKEEEGERAEKEEMNKGMKHGFQGKIKRSITGGKNSWNTGAEVGTVLQKMKRAEKNSETKKTKSKKDGQSKQPQIELTELIDGDG